MDIRADEMWVLLLLLLLLLLPPHWLWSVFISECVFQCACVLPNAHIVAGAVCAAAHWPDYRITAVSDCSTPIRQPQS